MTTEEAEQTAHEQAVYFRFFNEVGIINQLSSTRAERVMPHGLTMSQFSVLNHFSRGLPPKSPNELASAFQVTKGAMTNTLKQLEGKGFVTIKPHESDGRAKIVSASEEGLAAHRQAQQRLAEAFADLVEHFSAAEVEASLPFLEKMRIWLDNNR